MPDHIGPGSIVDVTLSYIEDYMPKTWIDAARDYPYYITANYLFTKHRSRKSVSEKCTWNYKVRKNDNTRATGLFNTASINRVDLFEKGEATWCMQDTHFAIDEREPAWNSGQKNQIYDYLDGQKQDTFDGFFEVNDEWFLSLATAPNDGTNGHPVPHALPYWITPSTTADFGFNGGDPSGYTATGGKDRDTFTKLKNGTFTCSSMSDSDGLLKISKAMDKCKFKPPKKVSPEMEIGQDFLLLTHEDWFYDYGSTLWGANDNVGMDAGKFRGKANVDVGMHMYRSVPWIYAHQFSDSTSPAYDSTKPIYGINWNTFFVYTYGDWFMKAKAPVRLSDQPNTLAFWWDTIIQTVCISPRHNFRGRVTA